MFKVQVGSCFRSRAGTRRQICSITSASSIAASSWRSLIFQLVSSSTFSLIALRAVSLWWRAIRAPHSSRIVCGIANPHRLEDLATGAKAAVPYGKALSVLLDDGFLQRFEILLDVRSLKAVSGLIEPSHELLSQVQGKEAAKDVSAYRLIPSVKDGARLEGGLYVPERVLDHPQLFVFEGNPCSRPAGVGGEHPFAIKAGLRFDLLPIAGHAVLFDRKVLAVALVANQVLLTRFELLFGRFDDGLSVRSIFSCLPLIYTDDVALHANRYLFYFQRRGAFAGFALRVYLSVSTSTREHQQDFLGEPGKRTDEGLDSILFFKLIETSYRGNHSLDDFPGDLIVCNDL